MTTGVIAVRENELKRSTRQRETNNKKLMAKKNNNSKNYLEIAINSLGQND
jgi:hypothetical protein